MDQRRTGRPLTPRHGGGNGLVLRGVRRKQAPLQRTGSIGAASLPRFALHEHQHAAGWCRRARHHAGCSDPASGIHDGLDSFYYIRIGFRRSGRWSHDHEGGASSSESNRLRRT